MSVAMITRRGGGSKGFDPNGAVLRVITSTGCSVTVISTGYNKTQADGEGYPRSGDPSVTEHFFSIPASAFGTVTVVATNAYGDNPRTVTIDTAGKVYDVLCGGINIILDQNFGWQNANLDTNHWQYSERYKTITKSAGGYTTVFASPWPSITAYSRLTVKVQGPFSNTVMRLDDQDDVTLCTFEFGSVVDFIEETGEIENKHYPTAQLKTTCPTISKIVFS